MLRAVRDALDIPHAATFGHDETRTEILQQRVTHAVIALAAVLDDPSVDVEWTTAYLRGRLAEHPAAGYVTHDQADAALDQGKSWPEAVTPAAAEDGQGVDEATDSGRPVARVDPGRVGVEMPEDVVMLTAEQTNGSACVRCGGRLYGACHVGEYANALTGKPFDVWSCLGCATDAESAGPVEWFARHTCTVCGQLADQAVIIGRVESASGPGYTAYAHPRCAQEAGRKVLHPGLDHDVSPPGGDQPRADPDPAA